MRSRVSVWAEVFSLTITVSQFYSRSPPGSSALWVISDTHPGLLKAVGPPAVVRILWDGLGLLELLPQPLYPVVVAGGQSAAVDGGNLSCKKAGHLPQFKTTVGHNFGLTFSSL